MEGAECGLASRAAKWCAVWTTVDGVAGLHGGELAHDFRTTAANIRWRALAFISPVNQSMAPLSAFKSIAQPINHGIVVLFQFLMLSEHQIQAGHPYP